jgi:hypothetical protein
MRFKVVEQDIRTVDVKNTVVAHCIAADLGWGSGIAPVIIREMFDAERQCRYRCSIDPDGVDPETELTPGDILPVEAKGGYLVNLITKQHSWDKPTYVQLTKSLSCLKSWMLDNDVPHVLVMPMIGCGLDRLEWMVVKPIIMGIFHDTDVDITVMHKGKRRV